MSLAMRPLSTPRKEAQRKGNVFSCFCLWWNELPTNIVWRPGLIYRSHWKLFRYQIWFFSFKVYKINFLHKPASPNYREFFKSAETSADYSLIYFDKLGLINLLKSNLWKLLSNENAENPNHVRYRIFWWLFIRKSWFMKISNL